MKINKLIRKYYVDIFFLIILLVIFLGGVVASNNVSADISSTDRSTKETAITYLIR